MDLKALFVGQGITDVKLIKLSDAVPFITRPDKLGCFESAAIFTVPYPFEQDAGELCQYACLQDYHKVIPAFCEEIIAALHHKYPQAKAAVFTDNSPFAEVSFAIAAGLGVRGKNNLLITPGHGSMVFIAELVTDILFSSYDPLGFDGTCSGCGRCIAACPSGALSLGGFDKTRCISLLTQKKGELTLDEAGILRQSGSIWGCDLCQRACPRNRIPQTSPVLAFTEKRMSALTLTDLEGLTDETFKEKYRDYAFAWRGLDVLKRNIHIIKGEER